MFENPPEESTVSSAAKANRLGWPSTALEEEKKAAFRKWSVMECFSNVFSLFSKTDLTPTKGNLFIILLCASLFEAIAIRRLRIERATRLVAIAKAAGRYAEHAFQS